MGHYSNGGLSCFSGTWSQLLSCPSQLRLIGTTDPETGPAQVSNRCPFDIKRAKTPVSECAVCAVVSDSLRLYPFRLLSPLGFSRQEYWSALPFPPPGDFPNPGVKPSLLCLLYCGRILYCWAIGEAPQISLKHLHFLTCIS